MRLIDDKFLWLEEVEGDRALKWVRQKNSESLEQFQPGPRYKEFEKEALRIYEASDKIPYGSLRGDYIYNFWQDEEHVRGLWRRTTLEEYQKEQIQWDILLDVDTLAEEEQENWVYKGVTCLYPDYNRCIFTLSRGGKDAAVKREYDISTRTFVKDGFTLPEAKSNIAWINHETVLVGTDFGPGSMTESGYPAMVKLWQRGQNLDDARLVMEINREETIVWGFTRFRPEKTYSYIVRAINFWKQKIFLLDEHENLQLVNLPEDADFQGFWKGKALAILRSDWRNGKQGALVALDVHTDEAAVLYQPGEKASVSYVATAKDSILINTLDNVNNILFEASPENGQWQKTVLPFSTKSAIDVISTNEFKTDYLIVVRNFLTPSTLYLYGQGRKKPVELKSLPARFDASDLEVEQFWATSKDGTQVPYFVVSKQGLKKDGNNPTLLYGYGGFEIPMIPDYPPLAGKLWLEKGGVYVLSNIRGGGEFGPKWHQAALKKNRHKAFEDFICIAEDLMQKKISSPRKLAIMGGSNGGLLMGATFTQRPELFKGVICAVPLLDMLRYHKLLAGASWVEEYGDPDDPDMREYLMSYSPYHNVSPDRKYPPVFFITSTKDDRVHPGHARKMVARMEEQGHKVFYYENIEGGHSTGANLKQYAKMDALKYVYLHRILVEGKIFGQTDNG